MYQKIKLSTFKFMGKYFEFCEENFSKKIFDFNRISTSLFQKTNIYKMQADREVRSNHLLRKKNSEYLHRIFEDNFSGEVILVTGAAGFVGSELCRQLVSYPLKKLILLDQLDSELYDIERELMSVNPYLEIEAILGDVKEFKSLESIFINERPSLIFHAAAYKNIRILEDNPFQAVGTNILATKYLADLSVIYKVKKFLFVSTDQALCSENIMAASKRVGEKYLEYLEQSKNSSYSTKFIITRFKNVQNNGLSNKINKGFYSEGNFCIGGEFVTVSDFCKLIIDACKMGNGGEIFSLGRLQNVSNSESSRENIVEYLNTYFNELFAVENFINIKPTFHPCIDIFVSQNIDHVIFNHEFNTLCKIWKNKSNDYKLIRQLFKIAKQDID